MGAVSRHLEGLRLAGGGLSFEREPCSGRQRPDFSLAVRLDGRERRFALECRLHPSATDIARLKRRKGAAAPLLAAPHLSETLAQACRDQGVSCLDLNGRLYLRHRGLLVDRQPQIKQYRAAEPEPALFAAKSSRLARWFLSCPGRRWRQDELARETGCSPALVSRLMGEHARLGWAEHREGRWHIVRPDALLDAWTGADKWSRRGAVRQYSTLERRPAPLAAQALSALGGAGGPLAFTQWCAAARRHPYAETPVVSAYCGRLPEAGETRELGWRPVGSGGRLWLIVPRDGGVFQCLRQEAGMPLACDAQIYLDLLQVGLRGPDAARALREWEGFCQP